MIKKFISKLLGLPGSGAAGAGKPNFGKRVEVPVSSHGIDVSLVDDRAVNVVRTLQEAGFVAYIVGGAVRDLLLGLRPKDFDVATDATPEQVKGLFRRAFIIGRRFRIVHVVYGRGREHEVIEVSTFRAYLDNAAAEQVAGNEKTSKSELAGMKHAVDSTGRVLRDNVWGPQEEDAVRRDFTINAMYYDPATQIVVDYHQGLKDAKNHTLRMIGDFEQLGHDQLVLVRALPQIDGGQLKAKHLHGPHERAQTRHSQSLGVLGGQGLVQGVQIGQQTVGVGVRVLWWQRVAGCFFAGQVVQRGSQPGVHEGEAAAVRLVLTVCVRVGRRIGQGLQSRWHTHQHGRGGQLAAQPMQLGQVVAQRHFALTLNRVLQGVGVHIRVAVAVAAHPLAHAEKRRNGLAAQVGFQVGIQLGNFRQKCGLVIAHGIFNFVGHGELGETKQTGLPELQHARSHLGFNQRHGAGGGGVYRSGVDGTSLVSSLGFATS